MFRRICDDLKTVGEQLLRLLPVVTFLQVHLKFTSDNNDDAYTGIIWSSLTLRNCKVT